MLSTPVGKLWQTDVDGPIMFSLLLLEDEETMAAVYQMLFKKLQLNLL
jgi:hypothetical protein